MISYNPNDYAVKDLRDDKFYRDMISNLTGNPSSAAVAITPFSTMCAVTFAGLTQSYYDISKDVADNAPIASRVFYHGNLNITLYCQLFTAGGGARTALLLPNRTQTFDRRTIAAADTNYVMQYQFQSLFFNFIFCDNLANATLAFEFSFTGVKISY